MVKDDHVPLARTISKFMSQKCANEIQWCLGTFRQ
jgi:hypothetical protein